MTLLISRTEHSRDPQKPPTVAHVQARLIGKGFNVGNAGADGIFGGATESATRRFQTHIGVDSDGIVGPITLRHLDDVIPPASIGAARFADRALARVLGKDGGPIPKYVFGAEVADLSVKHPLRLDCSELVQWDVFQETGKTWIDGSRYQAAACRIISADQAIKTKGALLFISSNGHTDGVHHVAISLGNGKTAEARSAHTRPQCGSWNAAGRFTFGGLIPIVRYGR